MQDPNRVLIENLTPRDKGRWVEYTSSDGFKAKGRIKSWGSDYIFVVYSCPDWDAYKDYGAIATKPEFLLFTDQLVG